jgi:NAD(P)-dependent dehydrogenase (short-subunit alcohol dehydrogenase family)
VRVVVVTGGGKGIGRSIVGRFAAGGDSVVAVGRDVEALAQVAAEGRLAGRHVTAEGCDITAEDAVTELFERIGPVDVLVNNAGVSASAPLPRTTLADWRLQLDVNATGAFLCTRAVLPRMTERGSGRIVTVASTAGIRGYAYTAAYSSSKHAAVGLMRAVAAEIAGSGVTANAVCPTFVRTDMTERSVERIVAETGRSREQALAALASTSRLGRLLEPEEVAVAVCFLASPEAAAINGEALVLDGGGPQR